MINYILIYVMLVYKTVHVLVLNSHLVVLSAFSTATVCTVIISAFNIRQSVVTEFSFWYGRLDLQHNLK